jgi:signal transduction histidine kinase
LEKIIAAATRMKTLIVDILAYSRLSADELVFGSIDLRNLVNEILEDFDLKMGEKQANITVGSLPVVEANRGQLRQVFYNIINNALKFVPDDRRPEIMIGQKEISASDLGISLEREADYCCVSIRDNGIGFDERFALSIFGLFEKLNPKSAFEGSGIGLSIAKKIIDKHHGWIIAKSMEGEGSEFNIILPYKHIRNDA